MTQAEQNSSDLPLSVGEQLKGLRESQNLSLEQANTSTRMPISKLTALEQDAFDQLGDDVFIRGYIRSYAKFLGGNGDKLVDQYHASLELNTMIEDVSADEMESTAKQDGIQKFSSLASVPISQLTPIAAGAVALLVVCFIIFGLFSGDDEAANSTALANSVEQPEVGIEDGAIFLSSEESPELSGEQNLGLGESLSEPQEADNVGELRSDRELLNISADVPTTIESTLGQASESEQAGATAIDTASGLTVLENAEPEVGLTPKKQLDTDSVLEFSFLDECWVEVRDANDEVVFADIQNSGDNLRLFGQAPFNIMFGNVRAVAELKINAQEVNVQPSGTRKTLRLTVTSGSN